MRQALARLDPGAALAIFRTVSGLSQQDVADIMGWSQSTVSLIEKGQRETLFDIRELVRFADMVEMPREALAPVLVGEPDATLGDSPDETSNEAGEDVDRRSFGGFAAGVAAAVVLPEITVPSKVTGAHVRYLRSCTDSLWNRDQAVGGGALLRQALRQWHRARRMLDESSYSEQSCRELMNATGEMAVCVGWLSYDSGDHTLARQLYSDALLLADQGGDDALAAKALGQMSLQSVQLARDARPGLAREAVRLSARAAELASHHDSTPRLHALLAARQAIAYAAVGDSQGFRTAITRAWRELDRGWTDEDPVWLHFVIPAEITIHEAKGRTYLGDQVAAIGLYQQSLENPGLSRRNRACYQAQFAAALAGGGEAAGAVAEGLAVLPALEETVASPRVLRELRPVRSAAEQVGAEEFCERYDKAARAVVA
jgi:transcriptional regulator with XRE-family HTH domain